MKKIFFMIIVGLLSGCAPAADNVDNIKTENNMSYSNTINYGNGVFYFPYQQADFGNALSQFIKDNPGLELVTITGNGASAYGIDIGQFVVFREIKNNTTKECSK